MCQTPLPILLYTSLSRSGSIFFKSVYEENLHPSLDKPAIACRHEKGDTLYTAARLSAILAYRARVYPVFIAPIPLSEPPFFTHLRRLLFAVLVFGFSTRVNPFKPLRYLCFCHLSHQYFLESLIFISPYPQSPQLNLFVYFESEFSKAIYRSPTDSGFPSGAPYAFVEIRYRTTSRRCTQGCC